MRELGKEPDIELARLLKDVRVAEGLTAEQLGKSVGLTQNYISRLENGLIMNPSFTTMTNIAYAISRMNVIVIHQFDLDKYDTPLVNVIKSHLYIEEVNKEYKLSINTPGLQRFNDNLEWMDEEAINVLLNHLFQKKIENVFKNFYALLKQHNLPDGYLLAIADALVTPCHALDSRQEKFNSFVKKILEEPFDKNMMGILLEQMFKLIKEEWENEYMFPVHQDNPC